jgi:hypothetical protein
MQWLRSQNELDHNLGNTNYGGESVNAVAQEDLENPYNKFYGWLGPFMRACSKLTESSDVSFYS